MTTYTKFPYRTEFPDSPERGRNSKTLEDALSTARWQVYSVWRETNCTAVGMLDTPSGGEQEGHRLLGSASWLDARRQQGREAYLR